jgi:hypothetical protein
MTAYLVVSAAFGILDCIYQIDHGFHVIVDNS